MLEEALTYKGTFRDYVILAKPGIVSLVLITTMTGIYLGNRGFPDTLLVFWTLFGTGLAASGSAILNNVYDRDIDALMKRTHSRAMPRGVVKPTTAFALGIAMIVVSFFMLSYFVNLLSALLAMAAAFVYVVVYTHMMKRSTPNATVIGGISGALPPVIGYAAVSGNISLEAVILFLIMLMWQPSHFWFLSIKYTGDYRKASIPAMPVSRGLSATKTKILLFNAALFPVSLLPFFFKMAGKMYLITAFLLGLFYIYSSVRLLFSKDNRDVFRFFYYSILYLAVLFSAMIADTIRVTQ